MLSENTRCSLFTFAVFFLILGSINLWQYHCPKDDRYMIEMGPSIKDASQFCVSLRKGSHDIAHRVIHNRTTHPHLCQDQGYLDEPVPICGDDRIISRALISDHYIQPGPAVLLAVGSFMMLIVITDIVIMRACEVIAKRRGRMEPGSGEDQPNPEQSAPPDTLLETVGPTIHVCVSDN